MNRANSVWIKFTLLGIIYEISWYHFIVIIQANIVSPVIIQYHQLYLIVSHSVCSLINNSILQGMKLGIYKY